MINAAISSKILNLLLIIFCILFVSLGFFSVAVMDDFWHAHFISKNFSIFSPIIWAKGQYLNWTGRILISIIQGLTSFPPLKTNLISALNAFLFLCSLYYYFMRQAVRLHLFSHKLLHYFSVMLIVVFSVCYPVLGESVYWAASVYIIPLFLFFICLDYLENDHQKDLTNWKWCLVFFLLGNSNELLVLPMIFVLWNKRKVLTHSSLKLITTFFCLGFLISFLAPGNISHLAYGKHDFTLDYYAFVKYLFLIYKKGFNFLGFTSVFLIPLVLSLKINETKKTISFKKQFWLYFNISLSSLLFLIPIYGFSADRTYLYFLVFQAIAIFWGLQYLKSKFKLLLFFEKFDSYILFLSSIFCIFTLVINLNDASMLRESFINQQLEIKLKSLNGPGLDVSISKMRKPMSNHLLFYADITPDKDSWPNKAMAKYYELNSVISF